jgi:hypothetical protein
VRVSCVDNTSAGEGRGHRHVQWKHANSPSRPHHPSLRPHRRSLVLHNSCSTRNSVVDRKPLPSRSPTLSQVADRTERFQVVMRNERSAPANAQATTSSQAFSPCPVSGWLRVVKALVGPKVEQTRGGPGARRLGMDGASRVVKLSVASRECLVDLVSCLGRALRSV